MDFTDVEKKLIGPSVLQFSAQKYCMGIPAQCHQIFPSWSSNGASSFGQIFEIQNANLDSVNTMGLFQS